MTVSKGINKRRRGAPFWDSVDKSGECWIWTAALDARGYGEYWDQERRTKVKAHRYAFMLKNELEDRLELHHTCHNKACVRPSHLIPLTHAHHMEIEGQRVTSCPKGHRYTPENTYVRPIHTSNGRRQCRTCHRETERKRRARNK